MDNPEKLAIVCTQYTGQGENKTKKPHTQKTRYVIYCARRFSTVTFIRYTIGQTLRCWKQENQRV